MSMDGPIKYTSKQSKTREEEEKRFTPYHDGFICPMIGEDLLKIKQNLNSF